MECGIVSVLTTSATFHSMKMILLTLCCLLGVQSSWSQDAPTITRDSLKTILVQLKTLSKTENIDSTLALMEFYEFHNANLEDPLHGDLVIADAMKRIEKTRAKQERRAKAYSGDTWSANPKQRTDATQSVVESVREVPFDEVADAVPNLQINETSLDQSQAQNTGEVENSVWTAQNEMGLTIRSDSKLLHAKLVEVQALLLGSRKNMSLSGASFAGGLIFLAIEGYAVAAISFAAIPVFAVIALVKRHNAIRALKSVQ